MMKNHRIIFTLFVFGVIHGTAAILCYSCADATDNKDLADCIHNTTRLRNQRIAFENANDSLTDFNYLKNCSHYTHDNGDERFQYCKIEEVESYGKVNAFIRDCCDLRNFSPVNVTSLRYIKPDNQTLCGYSHLQFATICVRVCTGDFCNGPNTGTIMRTSTVTMGLVALLITMS